jgi:hypothetical protein
MTRKFRITYKFNGWVSQYVVEASSKYNAKQRFYRLFPRAEILKVEAEEDEKED